MEKLQPEKSYLYRATGLRITEEVWAQINEHVCRV